MCVSTATTAAASRTRTTSTAHCHTVQGHASLSLMELTLTPGRAAFLASPAAATQRRCRCAAPSYGLTALMAFLPGPANAKLLLGVLVTPGGNATKGRSPA